MNFIRKIIFLFFNIKTKKIWWKSQPAKKVLKSSQTYTAKLYYKNVTFFNFPYITDIQLGMENSKTAQILHHFACVSLGIKKTMKPRFTTFGIFTKYRCFNASKWPQMLQKWRRTIPFGSGHTLGTLKHGLESLFYCFITIFGVGGSLAPPGAPWCPPGL